MKQNIEKYIKILIDLETIFKKAGKEALKLRGTAIIKAKHKTGVAGIDMVTNADLTVQEMILAKMAKTKLIECQLIAEENTSSVSKFKGSNGLVLTIDPIDGTFLYTAKGRLFSIIICLHDGKSLLYTFCHYPVANWSRRIANNKVKDFGNLPKAKTKDGVDLSQTIIYTSGDPAKTIPDVYAKLTVQGYNFRLLFDITNNSGSCTLFYLNQVAGYYKGNPGAYDGLCALHYAQTKQFPIYSDLDISKPLISDHGYYYHGWYLVLRK